MRAAAAVTLLLALSACSADERRSDGPRADPRPSATAPAPSSGPTQPPTPAEQDETLPPATDGPSLANLMHADLDGRGLRVLRTETRTDAYTRQQVTYLSDGTRVSGVLLRPHGRGPFPAVVLNHGYIEPSAYVTGQGLAREQDRLAREGFVVLHTDYRGHAAGDPVGDLARETRLGYVTDAITAVRVLQKQPYVDAGRTAMLGRSMGGAVTLGALAVAPGLVDAAVVYAGVSSDFLDNLRHFTVPNRPAAARAFFDRYGAPGARPAFYAGLSPRTHFGRITEPVLMFHGLADSTCPPAWSRTTHRLLQRAGVRSTLVEYPGEEHAFYARWDDSIERSVRFLRRQLA